MVESEDGDGGKPRLMFGDRRETQPSPINIPAPGSRDGEVPHGFANPKRRSLLQQPRHRRRRRFGRDVFMQGGAAQGVALRLGHGVSDIGEAQRVPILREEFKRDVGGRTPTEAR